MTMASLARRVGMRPGIIQAGVLIWVCYRQLSYSKNTVSRSPEENTIKQTIGSLLVFDML